MLLLLLTGVLPPLGDPLERLQQDPAEPSPVLAPSESDELFTWGALVRTYFTVSPSEASAGTVDISGVVFEDIELHFSGRAGAISWRVGADFEDDDGELEDAWARWSARDDVDLTMGQFRPRVLRSGSLPEETLLFRERTFLGDAFDVFDDGIELAGHYDQFDGWFALTDSVNGSDSDHFWSLRGEWALYDAAWDDREGARGSPNHLRALLGAFLFSDMAQSTSDASGYGADLAITFGPYAFHAEWADLEEEFARTLDVYNGHPVVLGDGKPMALTGARRLGEQFELALRFQRADDADDTQSGGAAVSWYPPNAMARFVLDGASVEADSRDFTIFSLGIVLGSSERSRQFLEGY